MDEREIASGLGDWLIAGKLSESTATSFAQEPAEKWKRGRIVGGEAETPPPTLRPSDMLEPEDDFTDKEEDSPREARYVIVSSPGSIRRLHDGCWMGQGATYNRVCKLCWPPKENEAASESLDEASSAHTSDGEETADGLLRDGWS